MRPTIRLLLLANLVYTALSFAQGTKPAEVAKHKFKHNGEIDSRYDASSDKTMVVLNPYKIPPKSQDVFSIMCGFTFKGRTISAPPDSIEFHIFSDGVRGWKFDNEKKRMLSATIDGEHVQLGEMKIVNTRHYAFNGRNGFLEQVYIQLTYEALVKVASGKRVWLNIGEEKIRLEDEHLEALRDLASRMVPVDPASFRDRPAVSQVYLYPNEIIVPAIVTTSTAFAECVGNSNSRSSPDVLRSQPQCLPIRYGRDMANGVRVSDKG